MSEQFPVMTVEEHDRNYRKRADEVSKKFRDYTKYNRAHDRGRMDDDQFFADIQAHGVTGEHLDYHHSFLCHHGLDFAVLAGNGYGDGMVVYLLAHGIEPISVRPSTTEGQVWITFSRTACELADRYRALHARVGEVVYRVGKTGRGIK